LGTIKKQPWSHRNGYWQRMRDPQRGPSPIGKVWAARKGLSFIVLLNETVGRSFMGGKKVLRVKRALGGGFRQSGDGLYIKAVNLER